MAEFTSRFPICENGARPPDQPERLDAGETRQPERRRPARRNPQTSLPSSRLQPLRANPQSIPQMTEVHTTPPPMQNFARLNIAADGDAYPVSRAIVFKSRHLPEVRSGIRSLSRKNWIQNTVPPGI